MNCRSCLKERQFFQNDSITRSIAGWLRFFVAALRHSTFEAYSVCYFQGRTFVGPSSKSALGTIADPFRSAAD